jgi:hypothetical protein
MTKMFLQKGRAPHGMVLPAAAQAVVNGVKDKSTLEKWGKGKSGATANVQVVPATVKDLKPTQAELNPEILNTSTEPTDEPKAVEPATMTDEGTDPGAETKKSKKKKH